MWNLAKTCAIVAICVIAADIASAASRTASFSGGPRKSQAVWPSLTSLVGTGGRRTAGGWPPAGGDPSGTFVGLSVKNGPLSLGEPVGPGLHQLRSHTEAHVVANCPFDIKASFSGLRAEGSGTVIPSGHLSVAINGKGVPIGEGQVTILQSNTPTGPGGEDVPVDLKVGFLGLPIYPAGRYHGAIELTIMARP